MVRALFAFAAVTACACAPTNGALGNGASDDLSGQVVSFHPDAGTSVAAPLTACATPPASDRRSQVCWRWACDGRAAVASGWNGSAATCDPGTIDAAASDRTLELVNLHRFLADMPPVDAEPAWSPAAQQCALVAHANAKLSHEPPSTWQCWSQTAYDASKVSLVANRSAPLSVGAFMEDPGNDATIVHRRWLLSDELTRIGIGSTDHYACIVVAGQDLDRALDAGAHDTGVDTGRKWAAWPPAGPVPLDVFVAEQLDTVGWTVQSGDDDLDPRTVVVSIAGVVQKTTVSGLEPQLGSRSAVKIVPVGWTTAAGAKYDVTVSGATTHIAFTVEPIDCAP